MEVKRKSAHCPRFALTINYTCNKIITCVRYILTYKFLVGGTCMNSLIFILFFAAIILAGLIIAAIVIFVLLSRSKSKNHLEQLNTIKAIANNVALSNMEVKEEFAELKIKMDAIERLLKEVE